MSDHLTIPAPYVGMPDARLTVDTDDHERYSMTLTSGDGEIIARGEGFGPGGMRDFATSDDADAEHRAHTVGTFSAFLAHALESSEDGARDGWPILTDAASDWTDALAIHGEDLAAPNRHDS
jgi:hypothetical protein